MPYSIYEDRENGRAVIQKAIASGTPVSRTQQLQVPSVMRDTRMWMWPLAGPKGRGAVMWGNVFTARCRRRLGSRP